MARNIIAENGEKKNPPIQAPKMAGVPAINPIAANLGMIDFVFDKGATIANPSVVLCMANPTIKNVLSARLPRPTAAPIAKPSPKL